MAVSEHDQSISEEQTYGETMRGIHSFMDWSNIRDMDSSNNASDDNHFAGPWESVGSDTKGRLVMMPFPEVRGQWPDERPVAETSQVTVQVVRAVS